MTNEVQQEIQVLVKHEDIKQNKGEEHKSIGVFVIKNTSIDVGFSKAFYSVAQTNLRGGLCRKICKCMIVPNIPSLLTTFGQKNIKNML